MARETGADACAHVPVRTCIGCRRRVAKHELLRVVVGGSAHDPQRRVAVPDPTSAAPGRGAYVHLDAACVQAAVRRRALGRALKAGPALEAGAVAEFVAQHQAAPPAGSEEQHPC